MKRIVFSGKLKDSVLLLNESLDNIRLIRLMEKKSLISIGMGRKGKISRLAGIYLGSPFTYASLDMEKETAEGQIDIKILEQTLKGINE